MSQHLKVQLNQSMCNIIFSATELTLLVNFYIQTDQMCDDEEIMTTQFWDTFAELYNSNVDGRSRHTQVELRTGYGNFCNACTRYSTVINEVIFENLFKPTRSTFEGRYFLKYHSTFIGHEAYIIRQNWLERFGYP